MASAFDNLNPVFSQRLQAMINASGGLLRPGSGFRTYEQQAKLYANYKAGVKGQAKAAPPGRSNHNHGLAMDLVDAKTGKAVQAGSAADRWLRANAAKFGLHQAVKGEAWHVELIDMDDVSKGVITAAQQIGALGTQELAEPQSPEDAMHDRIGSVLALMSRETPTTEEAARGAPEPSPQLRQDTTMVGGMADPSAEPGLGGIPPPGYEPPGRGAERWRPVAIMALRYTGQPTDPATVNLMIRRLNQESGGNPRAVNDWDDNAKRGDPTTGLMQNIPSAFNQRAKELAGRGITDGFANMVAAIRYSVQRYGSVHNAWNRRGGY